MEGAFAWLNESFQMLAQFVPRVLVLDANMGAVKFVRGAKVVPLKPGLHLYWPLTTNVQSYPTARQADDLRSQSIVTKDGKTALVGGMIVYEVVDVGVLISQTFRPEQTI